MKKLTASQQRIYDLNQQGVGCYEIAAELQRFVPSVFRTLKILEARGLPVKWRRRQVKQPETITRQIENSLMHQPAKLPALNASVNFRPIKLEMIGRKPEFEFKPRAVQQVSVNNNDEKVNLRCKMCDNYQQVYTQRCLKCNSAGSLLPIT